MNQRPELIVFDVNETLLSLRPIRDRMEAVFGPNPPTREWFSRMLHGSLLANELSTYRSFGEIGKRALLTVAAISNTELSEAEAAEIVAEMRSLPPHPEVERSIGHLAEAGYRIVALTNGSADVATDQIANAGLKRLFERVISVEEVGKFKPHSGTYVHAAAVMGVDLDRCMLVAAHDWDCAGALNVGMQAVFVARPGAVWGIDTPQPNTVSDLVELVEFLT